MSQGPIPKEYEWLKDIFTSDELDSLEAFFNEDTSEFVGIGFIGPGGLFTRFSELDKIRAIDLLEKDYIEAVRLCS